MKTRRAAIVSVYDIENYFTGGSWDLSRKEDGSVSATSEAYEVRLQQRPTKFEVKISAVDDPSDSETEVTDDPVKFITKFLSTGTEADDLLKRMSFVADPEFLSSILRRAALMSEVSPDGVSDVKKLLRRAVVAAYGPGIERILTAVVRAVAGQGDDVKEVEKIAKDMRAKGWKVVQDEGTLTVDISGIYEAEIRARDTVWDYSFQVRGFEESKEEGTTDDPIQQFRLFYKKDSTQDFKKQLKERLSKERASEETVKPGGQKSGKGRGEGRKVGDEPSSDGTSDTIIAPTQLPPSSKTHNINLENEWS